MRCESRMTELPSVNNGVQRSENERENSLLNRNPLLYPAEYGPRPRGEYFAAGDASFDFD
jgi:hypothetical protein